MSVFCAIARLMMALETYEHSSSTYSNRMPTTAKRRSFYRLVDRALSICWSADDGTIRIIHTHTTHTHTNTHKHTRMSFGRQKGSQRNLQKIRDAFFLIGVRTWQTFVDRHNEIFKVEAGPRPGRRRGWHHSKKFRTVVKDWTSITQHVVIQYSVQLDVYCTSTVLF
jgi:hypothetical protein